MFTSMYIHKLTHFLLPLQRSFNAPALYESDCTTLASDLDIVQSPNPLTTAAITGNTEYDSLAISYDINKSKIGASTSYNSGTGVLTLCQVVQLTESGMTISEDKRLITIAFNLNAVFSIGIDLETEAAATPVNGAALLASYVEAVKCSQTSNAGDPADTSALAANTDLYVCVRSTSSEVALASIDEMVRIISSFFLVPYAYHSTTSYKYNKDTHLLSFFSHILRFIGYFWLRFGWQSSFFGGYRSWLAQIFCLHIYLGAPFFHRDSCKDPCPCKHLRL